MKKITLDFTAIQQAITQRMTPHAAFVYLLGSVGTDRFREDSDIDIAFFPLSGFDLGGLLDLKIELEVDLDREVDLISLKGIDPIFGRQVVETGRLLFATDSGCLLSWKADQLSRYPDFKRSREVIEKNLLKRKKYV